MFVSDHEWLVAEHYLAGKSDGTVLPYSALIEPGTGKAIPRPKRPKLFNAYQLSDKDPAANTFHSFIKIDGEIFAIAQGKTPEAMLGEGNYGKVKFIQNKKGELAAVKIETQNEPSQQNETKILQDRALSDGRPLSRGKVRRLDKSKYYTHIAYLGVSLIKVLTNYSLQLCLVKPSTAILKEGILYLYLENERFYYLIKDEKATHHFPMPYNKEHAPVEKIMADLYKSASLFKKSELHTPENGYELILCEKEPSKEDIKYNRVYLYLNSEKNLSYALKVSDFKIKTGIPAKEYPFISKALNNTLLDESLRKTLYASAGLYPRGGQYPLALDEDRRLQAAIDICLQVDSLHRGLSSRSGTPTAHQDLKPENIVMDANGHCHLIDFGFATTTPEHNKSEISGTLLYLPPRFAIFILKQAAFDVVALKRVLTMPSALNCIVGQHTIEEEERRYRSVLTDEMVKKFKLEACLDTSFQNADSYMSVGTALALAAILIAAQLNLGIDYDVLKKSENQCLLILECYKNKKNARASEIKQTILEALAKAHPLTYIAIYLKENALPGRVDDIEKSRALIEAIQAGLSKEKIGELTTWEAFQIRGRIRAEKLGFIDTEIAFLKQTKSAHPSVLLGFAQTKTEAQRYLQFYRLLAELETKISSLDSIHKVAVSNLVTRLYGAILELNEPQNNRDQQFNRFSSSIGNAISENRSVLQTNFGLKKFLDDLCTVLASLIIFYPFVYVYQKKHNVHYSFFKPQSADFLDEIQGAHETLLSEDPTREEIIACT